ncbi:MAG: hypothetical protein GY805_17930 [Chloroflexi bacterium]|nr:hypothetical protein [Chloroflexota bacterium]
MSFDWQTDEDNNWNDREWRGKPETAVSSPPPWRNILLIVILLAISSTLIYQQVNKRLVAATTAVESDIFATHNLISKAAANNDAVLGKAVLSGRDFGWSRVQADLLSQGLFYEHAGLNLMLPEETAAFAPLSREDERFIELALDPDLRGAELTYARDFVALTDDGIETVTLQQTAVYRQGESRWLLAPPLEQFWGEWQTLELDNLTTIYPMRDEELLFQLSNDLQTLLAETCDALPNLDCAPDPPIQIRFDINPESLLETADLANLYDGNLRLNLPTPSLVGLPIDNDGYEALRQAYAVTLISALIGQSVGYDCCHHAPMFQAILTYQLSELGLAIWPVNAETQAALANSGVHTEMLYPYWNSDDFSLIYDEESQRLFGFVDFLLKEYASHETSLAILEQVNDVQEYQSWLRRMSGEDINVPFGLNDTISRNWWFYAMTQTEETTVSNQSISLPAQDLQISCIGNGFTSFDSDSPETELHRYQFANDSWSEEFFYSGLAFFNSLPQDDGIILQLVEVSETQQWQTLLWRNGTGVEMSDEENALSISLGQVDPNGRYLLYYTGRTTNISGGEALPISRLVDIDSCLDGSCSSIEIKTTPYWSPNGQQTLLSNLHLFSSAHYVVDGRIVMLNPENTDDATQLLLSDTLGNLDESVEVGEGLAPFWITNDLFGFIQPDPIPGEPAAQKLIVMSATDYEEEVIVETSVLFNQLPEDKRNSALFMRYAIAHPTNADLLIVMASANIYNSFIFQVNRQTKAVDLLFELDLSSREHSLGFSPNGRYLVATGSWQQESEFRGPDPSFGALHLHDLETGNHQIILTNNDTFFPALTFDWSLDGNWLAFTRDRNAIGLIAPAHGYQKSIIHQIGDCASLAWINPIASE